LRVKGNAFFNIHLEGQSSLILTQVAVTISLIENIWNIRYFVVIFHLTDSFSSCVSVEYSYDYYVTVYLHVSEE